MNKVIIILCVPLCFTTPRPFELRWFCSAKRVNQFDLDSMRLNALAASIETFLHMLRTLTHKRHWFERYSNNIQMLYLTNEMMMKMAVLAMLIDPIRTYRPYNLSLNRSGKPTEKLYIQNTSCHKFNINLCKH